MSAVQEVANLKNNDADAIKLEDFRILRENEGILDFVTRKLARNPNDKNKRPNNFEDT